MCKQNKIQPLFELLFAADVNIALRVVPVIAVLIIV